MGQSFAGLGSTDSDDMGKGTKLLEGGTKGLLTGFSDMQKQNAMMRQGNGGVPIPMPQQAQVSSDYFAPRRPQGNNLAFYGGSQ